MHCINTLNIVCLYSFKSIMIVTVIVHSFHSTTISSHIYICFSDGVENFNKTIHFISFSVLDHTKCDHVLTFLLPYFGLHLLCVVPSDTIGLDKCITVPIVDSIKINVKYIHLLMFLLGCGISDTDGLVWINLDTGVFVSGLTPDSNRWLDYWFTNIYCIVVSISLWWDVSKTL